jgi:hypothetical protein
MTTITLEDMIIMAKELSVEDRMRLIIWLQATITPRESALDNLNERKPLATHSGEFSIDRLREQLRDASPEWKQQIDNLVDRSTFSGDTH